MDHVSCEGLESSPRIGPEYQAEIPSVIKKSEKLPLQMNPADSKDFHDKSRSYAICLPMSETWSDADTKCFLLSLFIFGKNFTPIKRFIENKGMGEILSFYYGKFYKTDGYCRWSECMKLKGRKCMIGKKLFTGPRQDELLSRLIPHVSEESQDSLLQISKSFMEGRISLEKYISSLKSTVGINVLVEAVGIGNKKGDLTRLGVEPGKNSRTFSAPTCKSLSSLGPSDILQSLTGGFRLSKTKNNELFWEAVWPRLLARGWHSEQTKYRGCVTSDDYLVFLIPGVQKFSRRKLVKGNHYFDSVSDVLKKVVAEPNILVLKEEEAAKVGSCNEEELEKRSNGHDLSDDHRQCYLKPRSSSYSKDHIKFMVTDASLVHDGKPSDLRELKYVPINSLSKVDVDAAGKKYKGHKYMRKVNHSKDLSKNIKQNSTKLTVKPGSSRSSNFRDADQNFCGSVSHQQNGSSTASSANRNVEENNEKNILNDSYRCMSVSCVKIEKCESFSINIPQVPSNSENRKMMAMVEEAKQGLKAKDPRLASVTQETVEEPHRTPCDVGSLEQQPDINPRRQSNRKRPLTVRALEYIANEFLHVPKRQKRKDIQTQQDHLNPCCKDCKRGKTMLPRHCSDHGTAVLA
ncbi:putative transcription regulator Homeodomain-LIKE family [Medicago truncatula]|uniref:Homeodomain-like n=2 Tax=Medicago truncatula TaxID=3880 RepID=A2Q346_MEDTR|nr:Homeodomain-like [Medicago truncatula]AES82483.1 hypothetical protein MTR_7g113250 [Medicago truncatula]RHN49264.1 putative transcription regulator Homeodomain-LIKE family [Medicago truncatula]